MMTTRSVSSIVWRYIWWGGGEGGEDGGGEGREGGTERGREGDCVSWCLKHTDWSSEEVCLKALQQLSRVELAQEVGGALDIRCFSKLQPRSMALHLPLQEGKGRRGERGGGERGGRGERGEG